MCPRVFKLVGSLGDMNSLSEFRSPTTPLYYSQLDERDPGAAAVWALEVFLVFKPVREPLFPLLRVKFPTLFMMQVLG